MATLTIFLSFLLFVVINTDSTSDTVHIDYIETPTSCDRKAKNGDLISMHYKGNLFDVETKTVGKEFDSSHNRKQTFDFKLGAGQVIPGWEQGVPGMCVGEKRKLTVPPALAYGDQGFANLIPPKSTLVFEIELMAIKDEGDETLNKVGDEDEDVHHHEHEPDSFEAIDANDDKQITSEEMATYIKKFNEEGTEDKFENIDTIVGEIFQEDDKNKDGVISLEEYQHFDDSEPEEGDGDPEPPVVDEGENDADGHFDEEDEEYDDEGNELKDATLKEEL